MSEEEGATKPGISRRDFLKGSLAGAGAVASGSLGRGLEKFAQGVDTRKPKESGEQDLGLGQSLLVIDFAPTSPTEGILQDEFSQNGLLLQELAGADYASDERLEEEWHREDPQTPYEDWLVLNHQRLVLAKDLRSRYEDHGKNVAAVLQETWRMLDSKGIVVMEPLQQILDAEKVVETRDELGNIGVSYEISAEGLSQIISEHPDKKVIGLSLLLGKQEAYLIQRMEVPREIINFVVDHGPNDEDFTYAYGDGSKTPILTQTKSGEQIYLDDQGNKIEPMTREEYKKWSESRTIIEEQSPSQFWVNLVEPYSPKLVEENLLVVKDLVERNPDKFFIVAAGNIDSDLRIAKELLPSEIREKILFVGQWGGGGSVNKPREDTHGADIYVDNAALGLPHGSSFSTPFIEGIATKLLAGGKDLTEIRAEILKLSSEQAPTVDGDVYRLIDESKLSTLGFSRARG